MGAISLTVWPWAVRSHQVGHEVARVHFVLLAQGLLARRLLWANKVCANQAASCLNLFRRQVALFALCHARCRLWTDHVSPDVATSSLNLFGPEVGGWPHLVARLRVGADDVSSYQAASSHNWFGRQFGRLRHLHQRPILRCCNLIRADKLPRANCHRCDSN